jgi:BCD family chlorophyll transporter-like MFS transporter
MLMVAAAGLVSARWPNRPWAPLLGSLRAWTVGGCIASGLAMGALALSGLIGPGWPLKANVFILGVANGAFSIGAIGSMMRMAGQGRSAREGVRMGLWGAAQAIAFGLGGLAGAAASDLTRWALGSDALGYAAVFGAEALLFVAAARIAAGIGRSGSGEFRIDPADGRPHVRAPGEPQPAALARN